MRQIVLWLVLLAMPALAQDPAQDKAELCKVTSGIAGDAVSARGAGATEAATIAAITADLPATGTDYTSAVQPIVEWVYTLPEEQLTDEVQAAYQAACLEQ